MPCVCYTAWTESLVVRPASDRWDSVETRVLLDRNRSDNKFSTVVKVRLEDAKMNII